MKKILQLHLLLIFISLALGQLVRFALTPQIAVYPHDLLVVSFITISLINRFIITHHFKKSKPKSNSLISKNKLKLKITSPFVLMLILILFIFIRNFFIAGSIIPYLYQLRIFIYCFFACEFYTNQVFSNKQFVNLITLFFAIFTILGFTQYLFLPDVSSLEYLGWDDHYYRLIGSWFDPAFTGLAFVFGLIFFYFLKKEKVKLFNYPLKINYWLILLSLFLALIFTYSRSSYLSFITIASIFFFKNKKIIQPCLTKNWQKLTKKYRLFLCSFILGLLLSIPFTLTFMALHHQSDSTNLLRTNSIDIRYSTFKSQLNSLTPVEWLFGKGFFVGTSEPNKLFSLSNQDKMTKNTMSFPDNFFVLLLSFFGLPFTLIIIIYLFKLLKYLYRFYEYIFYLLFAVLINAQFNQSFFQPFVFLLFSLLSIYFWHYSRPDGENVCYN